MPESNKRFHRMISGVIIQNFKGISERVEIELRPLTLLFGTNGAGKSTVIDAINVLEEILLERHERRGKSIERRLTERVGSIDNVIHGQDWSRQITLGITIHSYEDDFDYFSDFLTYTSDFKKATRAGIADAKMPSFFSMGGLGGTEDATSLTVLVTIQKQSAYSQNTLVPVAAIREVSLGVNGRELVKISGPGVADGTISEFEWQVDTDHPVLSDSVKRAGKRSFSVSAYQILPLPTEPPLVAGYCHNPDGTRLDDGDGPLALSLNIAISASLQAVDNELKNHRRLGPMRIVPSPLFRPQPSPGRDDWLNGQAAWDQLAYLKQDQLDEINDWLGSDKLDTGIEVVQRLILSASEWDASRDDPLLADKLSSSSARDVTLRPIPTKYGGTKASETNLPPSQVGTGVSQLVPVVVACVNFSSKLLSIAQPELHLHPRLQVKLGDLFIDSVGEDEDGRPNNQLIIETHSEHLILRVLRRIRETSRRCAPDGFELASDDLIVYHVSQEEGHTRIRKYEVDSGGHFVLPWPDDFFEIDFYERFTTGDSDAE
ncbi:AAA family ATPase [Schlesneria sp. T3-172]|uniref:AAA family ATPase n=1 Tax=Schlesneria sphaerica TaxID=3373610 RepID=UPI0037C88FB1